MATLVERALRDDRPVTPDPGPWHDPVFVADQRTQLEAMLAEVRSQIAGLLDGLTEEQARRRLVASATTPLALVKHATFVETVWAHVALTGRTREQAGLPEDVEHSFLPGPDDTVASVRAAYVAAGEEARSIAAAYDVDDLAWHNRRSPLTLRWVYLHLIAELSRHAGHGDILREQILRPRGSES